HGAQLDPEGRERTPGQRGVTPAGPISTGHRSRDVYSDVTVLTVQNLTSSWTSSNLAEFRQRFPGGSTRVGDHGGRDRPGEEKPPDHGCRRGGRAGCRRGLLEECLAGSRRQGLHASE